MRRGGKTVRASFVFSVLEKLKNTLKNVENKLRTTRFVV